MATLQITVGNHYYYFRASHPPFIRLALSVQILVAFDALVYACVEVYEPFTVISTDLKLETTRFKPLIIFQATLDPPFSFTVTVPFSHLGVMHARKEHIPRAQ